MKLVINTEHGGFGLSSKAEKRYAELSGTKVDPWEADRNDPFLIQVVEELGDFANDRYAQLKIVEIPDDVDWCVQDYDGYEWIAEKHRTWKYNEET